MFLPVLLLLPQQKWQCCQTLTCGPRLNKASLAAWRLPCHTLTAMETVPRLWLNRTHPIPIGYNYNHLLHLYMSEGVWLWFICVHCQAFVGRVPGFLILELKGHFLTLDGVQQWYDSWLFLFLACFLLGSPGVTLHPSETWLCLHQEHNKKATVLACVFCCVDHAICI